MSAVYKLDGNAFSDLAGFAEHFSTSVLVDHNWRGNLDAFNDILRGGFGTPEDGFTLRLVNASTARRVLGYAATIAWLEERAANCHPSNRAHFIERLGVAKAAQGPTLFDVLVEIIRDHGPGGRESEDAVVLELDDEGPVGT